NQACILETDIIKVRVAKNSGLLNDRTVTGPQFKIVDVLYVEKTFLMDVPSCCYGVKFPLSIVLIKGRCRIHSGRPFDKIKTFVIIIRREQKGLLRRFGYAAPRCCGL